LQPAICLQARELAKQKEEAEALQKAQERARIEREAAAQRATAQKKKEAAERKAAVAAAGVPGGKGAQKGRAKASQAVMRSKPVKLTVFGQVNRFCKQNSTVISVVAMVLVLTVIALWSALSEKV
jgi:hypothetical protein